VTNVFYLISSLAQGGAERHLLDLIRQLDPNRFATDICVLNDRVHFKDELPPSQPRYRLKSRVWASPFALARLLSALRAARPQILHTYMNDANLWGRLATYIGPKPRVITSVHLDDMSPPYRFWERRLAHRSDRIVAHSRSIQALLVDGLGIASERVVVIANGIDPEQFRPSNAVEIATARETHDLGVDKFVALMAARIAPQKNQLLVVEGLGLLKAAGALPSNFLLLFAGRVSSEAYHRRVRVALDRAGVGDQVRFLGPVRDMRSLYGAADVILMPSRTEASPIAALEALACGVPVLLSAASNTDAVLIDGQHGWEIGDVTAASIAGAVRDIVSMPSTVRREKGVAARAHVLARFTTARVADDFMRLYDDVSARPPETTWRSRGL
jgi:glycosyltransferase involved in cell wall biosynthesis